MDLALFADEHGRQRKTRCFVCNLPDKILAQVNASRSQVNGPKVSYRVITMWLEKEDQGVGMGSVANHFQMEHDKL